MNQALVSAFRKVLRSTVLRRNLSSSSSSTTTTSKSATTIPKVGTIQRRNKLTPGFAAPGTPEAELEIGSVAQEVTGEVFRNNVLLAGACVAFAGGVMWYSMHAVGQSGSTADDPLAALKEEASEAQAARDKENLQSSDASAMLKQFESGAFDPDKLEEDEDEAATTPRKPWWKFW